MNKSAEKRITIVIPSKKYDANLSFCIKKIRQFYKKIKIIIILDKKEFFKKDSNMLLLISGNKSIGYKRNLAVKNCASEFVCFIDSDAYPTSPWLDQVEKSFLKYKRVGAIGGPNLSPKTKDIEKILVARSRKFSFVTLNTSVKSKDKKKGLINFLPSCNLIVKTKIYKKLGGMYEGLYSGEEISLIKKLKKNNFNIVFNSDIYVFHKDRNFKHFFRQRFIYGSTGLKLLILFPCRESFLVFISSTPTIYLLILPYFLINKLLLPFYLIGLIILTTFLLINTFRINFSNNFFKSLKLSLIGIFAPGLGFIFSLMLKNDLMKKLYTQK